MTTQEYSEQFKQAFINKAMSDVTRYVIEQYFKAMNTDAGSDAITSLFSEDVNFYLPNQGKSPHRGITHRCESVMSCIHDLRMMVTSIFFDIKSMDVDGEEAVVLAELTARQRKTGETIHKEVSFQFTVHNGLITRFRIYNNNITAAALTDNMQEQEYANVSN